LRIPTGRIVDDPGVLEQYRTDQSVLSPAGRPLAAVIALSDEDVTTTLAYANEHAVPVVTRGAGSGLAGAANATDGCIVLVTAEMNRVVDLNQKDLVAVVEPGVINGTLKQLALDSHLLYPPDPASYEFSTLGGNIATNAGGLCCVKYGVTGDYVIALDVALADGQTMTTGSTTRKSVAGYDMTSLLVGSEGTLAVILSATLRLIPRPQTPGTVVAFFKSLDRVGELPGRLAEEGITPSMLELMDRFTINAIEDHFPLGSDRSLAAMVIAQDDSSDREVVLDRISKIAIEIGAGETFQSADPVEAEMLLQARRLAFLALEKEPGVALLDDVVVPVSRVPELIEAIELIGNRFQVRIGTFGHLGDGNLHPTILYKDQDRRAALGAFDSIIESALNLGGSATGEHGIGLLKREHVGNELLAPARELHRKIKFAFDPNEILNPGKAIPDNSTLGRTRAIAEDFQGRSAGSEE
jgi:glycolate oxidase